MTFRLTFASLGLILVVVGCTPQISTSRTSDSGGQIVTRKSEQRPITGFNQIQVSDAIEVHMMSQAQCTVAVAAPSDVLPLVKTELDYGTLKISVDAKNLQLDRKIQVYLSSVDLIGVDLRGASVGVIENIKERKLVVKLSGASVLKLKGRTRDLQATIEGASKLDAGPLVAERVTLTANGSSRALVNASSQLKATATGASVITYKGGAKTEVRANDVSTISPAGR